jgi:RNA polymerase sigma-54 factor
LDPAGIGARDLRECLLIQVERCRTAWNSAWQKPSLDKHFEAFSKKHYDRILERLEIDEEALKGAIELIVRLNPKPGNTMRETDKPTQEIIPDFMVMAIDGELELSLNGRNAPELRVSRQYRDMIRSTAQQEGQGPARGLSSSSRNSTAPSGSSMPSSSGRTPCW